jgi:Domain of unknown function (DUF4189)
MTKPISFMAQLQKKGFTMTFSIRGVLGAVLAALIVLVMLPSSALAQAAYPCPYGGPSPGHRVVGQTPAGNGVGSILLCVADDTGQSNHSQKPPPPERELRPSSPVDAAYAITWHKNASEAWTVSNTATVEEAEKLALNNCNSVMGSGCVIALSGTNTFGSIARTANGIFISGRGGSPNAAQADALNNCAKYSDGCTHYINAGAINRQFGDTGELLTKNIITFNPRLSSEEFTKYASVAMVAEPRDEAYKETIWISRGHSALDDAHRSAQDACQKETGKACVISTYSAHGIIYAYRTQNKELLIFAYFPEPGEDATDYTDKICTARKMKCELIEAFSARKAGLIKRDFSIEKAKK